MILLKSAENSLARPATKFSVATRIVVVNDDMGDLGIIKIRSDLSPVLQERLRSGDQTAR